MTGSASVSTFSTIVRPASSRARAVTSGAAMRHGPHHDAQKSTKTGTRASLMIALNDVASASNGDPSGGRAALHAPHRPVSARCSTGTRLLAPQDGHGRTTEKP